MCIVRIYSAENLSTMAYPLIGSSLVEQDIINKEFGVLESVSHDTLFYSTEIERITFMGLGGQIYKSSTTKMFLSTASTRNLATWSGLIQVS